MEFCFVRLFQPTLCLFGRHLYILGSTGLFSLGSVASRDLMVLSFEVFPREKAFRGNPGGILVCLLRLG